MKRYAAYCAVGLLGFGCVSETTDGTPHTQAGLNEPQVIASFTTEVVLATYTELNARLAALSVVCLALAETPTPENLTAAQQAWVQARVPWEQSEGFLFGPVSAFGYDPALDSWPVNRTDLDQVMASDMELTQSYVASLQETQKGFHTVEYLLFGQGGTRVLSELTPRHLEYLAALAAELEDVSGQLLRSWTEGVDGGRSYQTVFATAGEAGNTAYPSVTAAAQEILGGMAGICDEVANGKIADPYDAQDPDLVESQFSYNSIADFQDNIRSVAHAYSGRVGDVAPAGHSISAWVAGRDADLDRRVREHVAIAIVSIGRIPSPFSAAIQDPEASDEIEAAQVAIRALQDLIEGDLSSLVVEGH